MRTIRTVLLAILAIVLVTVALANRDPVTLRVLPDAMAGFAGFSWQVTLPLFVVLLFFVLVGLLVGFVWEWAREHKHRAAYRREHAEKKKLEREVSRQRTARAEAAGRRGDDVLALLEDGSAPR